MVLYAYYKTGFGLFTNTSGTTFENADLTMSCNEAFLVASGFTKLLSYKIIQDTYNYVIDNKFAQQPTQPQNLFQFVDATRVEFIDEQYMTDATFFAEIQYNSSYLL